MKAYGTQKLFIVALFIIDKKENTSDVLQLENKSPNNSTFVHEILPMKRDKLLIHIATEMNLSYIILNLKSQMETTMYFYIYVTFWRKKNTGSRK